MANKLTGLPWITANIEALTHDGRGITTVQGKKVFVAGALPGELVQFSLHHRHSHFDEGQVATVMVPSSHRQPPVCLHFGICGGCHLQHVSLEGQWQHKQEIFLNQLTHIAGLNPKTILPPLHAQGYGYRAKARLSCKFVAKKNKLLLGFHEKKHGYVLDMQECHVLMPQFAKQFLAFKHCLAQMQTQRAIPQVELAIGDEQVALIIRHLIPLVTTDLTALTQFAQSTGWWIYLQSGGIQSTTRLWPEPNQEPQYLSYRVAGISLQFHPNLFIQVNPAVNAKLVPKALDLLQLTEHDHLLDLFCGLGNFTLPAALRGAKVTGIEGSAELIDLAAHNAKANNLTGSFAIADLNETSSFDQEWAQTTYDKLLLDPPRAGAENIAKTIAKFGAKRIVYVSCHSASFARDAKWIAEQGYTLEAVGIVDMFPQTYHTESIALFTKETYG